MRLWPTLCRIGTRFCLVCVGRLVLWTFWLGLCVVLGLSTWIACNPRLDIPQALIRHIERDLSVDGVEVHIGGIIFSTTGQLLVSDLRLNIAGFEDPILKIENAQTTLNPWAILSGSQGAHQIEFSGAKLVLPAQISPTGTAQPLLENIDGNLAYGNHRFEINRLNARCAGLDLRITGAIDDSNWRVHHAPTAMGPELLAGLRRAAVLYPQVRKLGQGWLELQLHPDSRCLALASIRLGLNELRFETPVLIEGGPLQLSCGSIPLRSPVPFPLIVEMSLAHLSTPKASADGLLARLDGRVNPASSTADTFFIPETLLLSATRVSNQWIPIEGPSLVIKPVGTQKPSLIPTTLRVDMAVTAAGNLNALSGLARPAERSAEIDFRSEVDSALIIAIGQIIGRDILKFCSFRQKASADGHLSLAPGGKLRFVEGDLFSNSLDIYRVAVEHVSGHVRFDGTELLADRALLRMGDNFARGSYGMNIKNADFRFLLSGRLRPDRINNWFKGWWPGFWENFDFSYLPPTADIDVAGRWGTVGKTEVFVGVDASHPTLRGVNFDRARTRLFIRPQFVHALDIEASRPEGTATAWFSRFNDPERGLWTRINFEATSTLDPLALASLLNPDTHATASNFIFEKAPSAHASGWLDGPGATKGPAHHIEFQAKGTGLFTLFRFPLSDPSFSGVWDGPEIRLSNVVAQAAQGRLTGSARFDTEGTAHRLDFAGSLTEAHLGAALDDIEGHIALLAGAKHHRIPDLLAGTLVTLYASASGNYSNPYSFHGKGNAHIWGEELAKVRLLGGLSQLLSFTSLRFTSAKAKFELDGAKVQFPTVRLLGRNSAIDAYGSFQLDTKAISFNAKVWPFDQTPGLFQSAMGLVLSPLSHALEVKLSGTLSNPSWAFIYNPFRALSGPAQESEPSTPEASPPVPPTTPFK